MLDPRSLEAFLLVVGEGGFLRAADRLGCTQSVISKRIQRLEDQLGTPLLQRGGKRSVELTRAGRLFLPQARQALEAIERAERSGRRFATGDAGPIRIGYVFSAALNGVLPQLVGALTRACPDAELQLEPMDTPSQLEALAQRRLDIALVRPRPSYPAGAEAFCVHSEGMLLAMATTHRLTDVSQVEMEQLVEETFVVPQFHEDVGLIDGIRAMARQVGTPIRSIVRARDFISAATLAAAGAGVILAPESLTRLDLDGLTFRPIARQHQQLDLMLVINEDVPDAPRRVAEGFRPPARS